MNRTVVVFAVALAMMPRLYAQRTDTGNSSVIVVTGEATVRTVPDEATVRLGIVRQASTAQLAQDQANTAASEILAAITKVGVPSNDIQTSRLTLTPVYAPRSPESSQAPRIAAYQASNMLAVRLTDLAKVGPVIDAGLKAGSNDVQGIQFGLRNDLPVRQQALKEAVVEARKKAEAIAEASGATLGMPLEISENGVSVMQPQDAFRPMTMARDMA